jgi:hypothetical protein
MFRHARAAIIAVLLIAPAASAQQPPDKDLQEKTTTEPEASQIPRPPADPTGPGFVKKAQRYIKEKRIVERLSPRNGLYPRFKGLTTGSGFAAGAGYRQHMFDDKLFADLSSVISMKNYKAVDAKARWLRFWNDRVELWSEYRYRDFPEEDFFGMGQTSSETMRTSYAIESHDIITRGIVTLQPWLRVGADLGYFRPDVGHGADAAIPSIEELFDDARAPGLAAQPNYLHNAIFAEVDTRDHRGKPSRGGFYRAEFGTWDDRTLQAFDFHRFDAEAAHFLPVRVGHVIALRGGISYVNNASGERVPFYFFPYVGGSDTLRGYREFRFRDENAVFFNSEYRWDAIDHLEIAPFFDVGKVSSDWQDLNLDHMRTAYGIGLRLHADSRVFFRFDLGMGGGEGRNYFLKFGPSF